MSKSDQGKTEGSSQFVPFGQPDVAQAQQLTPGVNGKESAAVVEAEHTVSAASNEPDSISDSNFTASLSGGTDADQAIGGAGDDQLEADNATSALENAGRDGFLRGSLAADALFGDVEGNGPVSGEQAVSLNGSEDDDHMWNGEYAAGDALDVFVKQSGTGTDYIHDFEVEADVVDLSAYNISFHDLQSAMQDVGWATQIELTSFSGQVDDRIYLKNVEPDQLDESNFSL